MRPVSPTTSRGPRHGARGERLTEALQHRYRPRVGESEEVLLVEGGPRVAEAHPARERGPVRPAEGRARVDEVPLGASGCAGGRGRPTVAGPEARPGRPATCPSWSTRASHWVT